MKIEYEELPPVFTIEESERQEQIVWGKDNLIKSFLLEKGNVDSVWESAAHIVEGEYRTGAQEHLYIENNGIIAEWNAKHAIGTRVAFRYLLDGPELGETRTRSQAYPSGSREKDPMVQIEARAGGWCITHLRVLEDAP